MTEGNEKGGHGIVGGEGERGVEDFRSESGEEGRRRRGQVGWWGRLSGVWKEDGGTGERPGS